MSHLDLDNLHCNNMCKILAFCMFIVVSWKFFLKLNHWAHDTGWTTGWKYLTVHPHKKVFYTNWIKFSTTMKSYVSFWCERLHIVMPSIRLVHFAIVVSVISDIIKLHTLLVGDARNPVAIQIAFCSCNCEHRLQNIWIICFPLIKAYL